MELSTFRICALIRDCDRWSCRHSDGVVDIPMELSTFLILPCNAKIGRESRMEVCAYTSKMATVDINILKN